MPMIDIYAAKGTFADPHKLAIDAAATVADLEILGVTPSRLPGAEGNLEYFLHARKIGA